MLARGRNGPLARAGTLAMPGLLAVALAAGCGTSSSATGATGTDSPSTAATGHGPVKVLYAGSLVNLMEHGIGPAFRTASGYSFQGFSAGSKAVANQIKGEVRQGDVFISASPAVNETLEGSANGNWVTWDITFAKAPLVIGYNPHSAFAAALKSRPWYQVITEPGIKLGRTDPKLDPKGKLTVQALQQAAQAYHQAGLAAAAERNAAVFPEEDLVGRLQSGQLDAGFFYSNEAVEKHIPTVSLGSVHLSATYTVTVLNNAPDAAGAAAFVRYLLGSGGRATMRAHGLTVLPPAVAGDASAVPPSLKPLVRNRAPAGTASPGAR